MDRRAVFQAKLKGNHYRTNAIVRSRLESPCEVTIKIVKSAFRVSLLERYDILLNGLYIEPLAEEVLGCFMDIHHNVQEDVLCKTKPIDDWKRNRESPNKIKGNKVNAANGPKNNQEKFIK